MNRIRDRLPDPLNLAELLEKCTCGRTAYRMKCCNEHMSSQRSIGQYNILCALRMNLEPGYQIMCSLTSLR